MPSRIRVVMSAAGLFVLAHCGSAGAQQPAPSQPPLADTLAQRLKACAICHGEQGEGKGGAEYYPRLAGKPSRYLYLQLVNYRDGKRTYPQMIYLMRYMTDAYLQEIADHYAKLQPPFLPPAKPPTSPPELARGEMLATRGDAAKNLPACDACHGKALTGTLPAIPGLVGLPPDYIAAQLGAWKTGTRVANAPDCMHEIARRMDGADIAAVAKWLGTRPGMPDAPATVSASRPLPLACGSQTAAPTLATATSATAAAAASPSAPRTPATTPAAAASAKPPSSPADVLQRGEYLARVGDCIACHTTRGSEPFAGGHEMHTPFGTLFTPNITPDRETGIGRWTADQFWQALHLGRAPDGSAYYPAFPYPNYTRVTREDADAMFAYLQSRKPVRKKNRAHTLGFPYNQRGLLNGWRALYFEPGVFESSPTQSAEWNRGAYLVQGLGHCDACHTGRNILGATRQGDAFAGGVMPITEWYAPSLAARRESGLGQWDIRDIVDFLHTGVSRRAAVYGPMSQVVFDSLQYMTEPDVRAMGVYLKSLVPRGAGDQPPQIRTTAQQTREMFESGRTLYEKWCADCHLGNGAGIPPAYPPLAGNQSITMDFAANPVRVVMFGGYPPATHGNPRPYGMPPFAHTLNDQEIAAVVTYIRQAWGNSAGAISFADVAKYRNVPIE